MAATIQKLARPPPAAVESAPPPLPPPPQPKPIVPKLKKDPDLAGSLPEKPTTSAPIIACRKRSSISNKAKKEERDEKHDLDRKEQEREGQNLSAKKSNTRERSATRGLRTNKNRSGHRGAEGGAAVGKSTNPAPSHKSKPVESTPAVEAAVKAEKKSGGGAGVGSMEKKRSPANFLNRIKRSSPSSNGTSLETLKGSSSEGSGRGAEQKKGGKGDRKAPVSRQEGGATYAKKAPEPSAPGKRSVGRPPKRAVAQPTPTLAKRAREEAGAAPTKPPTASSRKRARK